MIDIKRELKYTINKHKDDKVEAFATNIASMAEECLVVIERLEAHNSIKIDEDYISSDIPEIRGVELNQVKIDLLTNMIILFKNNREDIIYNNLTIIEEYTSRDKVLREMLNALDEVKDK